MISSLMDAQSIDMLALLAFVGALAAAGALVVRRWPKAGLMLWLLTVAFVPEWLGVSVGGAYLRPIVLVTLFVLVLLLPVPNPRLGPADLLALIFFAACVLPVFMGEVRVAALMAVLLQWVFPWLLGRIAPLRIDFEWITVAFAIVMGVVAAGALAEFLFHYNPFPELVQSNRSYDAWAPIQERGGVARTEGAFGHSIALGASLALAIPFAIASKLRLGWRVGLVVLMLAAIVTTLSRTGMLAGGFAVLLSVYGLRNGLTPRVRVGVLVGGAIAMLALSPFVLSVMSEASDEASVSSAYRGELLGLLDTIAPIGAAEGTTVSAGGSLQFGSYDSIDSALLLLALNYGFVAAVAAISLWVGGFVHVLRRRGGPAVIAVVAQAPALLTVALITQYASLFWFIAGLAVYSVSHERLRKVTSDSDSAAAESEPEAIKSLVHPVMAGSTVTHMGGSS